ncbi:MAG: alpha/beta hydrolase [Actinomycetota bacterium]
MSNPRTPTTVVDVGGTSLHAYPMGEATGRPTVVFEAGLGGFGAQWHHVQHRVAEHTATVSYDRAGTGGSAPAPLPRTLDAVLDDLDGLLDGLGVEPPLLLVGHSLGGLLLRCFARRRPGDVAGLVLVDSSHEHQRHATRSPRSAMAPVRLALRARGWLSTLPQRFAETPAAAEGGRGLAPDGRSFRAAEAEVALFGDLFGPSHRVPTELADLPLSVISADRRTATGRRMRRSMDEHQELQADLVRLSSLGGWCTVPGANHLSLLLDPRHAAAVAEVVLDLG